MFRSKYRKIIFLNLIVGAFLLLPVIAFAQTTTPTGPSENNTVWANIQNTRGVETVWSVSLGLVDFIVVAGLIVSAFANIFRLKIDTYGVKQILPGLIIGIILANLSYFIMRLFIEGSSVFTQFIASIIQQIGDSGGTVGDRQVGVYLANRAAELLIQSIFTIPSGWLFLVPAAGVAGSTALPIAATVLGIAAPGFVASALVGGAIILFLLWALVALAPFILFLFLLFLLYIRNYILILCFMIAPLAFFALGFPPLRKFWQMWWTNFWKWLIMPILAWTLVGFMIIFLNAAALDRTGDRSLFDYFFFNGIAILILYFATRIPFMFGSFFGVNVMQNWSNAGKKGANLGKSGVKRGWDYFGSKRAEQFAKRSGDPSLEARLDRMGKFGAAKLSKIRSDVQKAMPGIAPGSPEFEAEVRRRAGVELANVNSRRNPFRQIQAAANVYKNYLEEQQKLDARHTRRSPTYERLSKKYTLSTYTAEQYQRHQGEYQDNEDIAGLTDVAIRLRDRLISAGFSQADAGAEVRRLVSTSADNLDRAIDGLPAIKDPNLRSTVLEEIVAGKQLRRALNIALPRGTGRTAWNDFLNTGARPTPYTGAPNTSGGAPGAGGPQINVTNQVDPNNLGGNQLGTTTSPYTGSPEQQNQPQGDNDVVLSIKASAEGGRRRNIPVEIVSVANRAKDIFAGGQQGAESPKMHLSEEDRDFLAGVKPKTIMQGTSSVLRQSEANMRNILSSRGMGEEQIGSISSQARAHVGSPTNRGDLGDSSTYGLSPEQFTPDVQSAVHDYAKSVKGAERVMFNSLSEDPILDTAHAIARSIDSSRAKELESVVSGLEGRLTAGASPQQLEQIRNELSSIAPQALRISPQVDERELAQTLQNTKAAVKLQLEAGSNDPAVLDKTIAKLKGEKLSLHAVADAIDTERKNNPDITPESLASSAELQDAIQSAIGTLRHTDPELAKSTTELTSEQIQSIGQSLSTPIVEKLQAELANRPDINARILVDDESLSNQLRAAMRNQFTRIATSPPVQTPPAAPTAAPMPTENPPVPPTQ